MPFPDPFRWLRSRFKRRKSASIEPDLPALLNGYRSSALLYVAAKLKIPDALSDRPRSSADLAKTLKLHESSLHRVLRGLSALGICTEDATGRFQLTRAGLRLCSTAPGSDYSLAILNGEEYAHAWNNLLHSVISGETAFDRAFGQSPWEHRRTTPGLNDCFNTWLKLGATGAGESILNAYDFSTHRCIADIGGGNGSLIATLLKAHSTAHGILFDQPHVIPAAREVLQKSGVAARCELVEGSFFESVPDAADVYLLKSILHDWNDEQCLAILRNCQTSLKSGTPLLVIEKIVPPQASTAPSVIMSDLHMLAITGGLERTAAEYKKLFDASGFQLKRIIPLRTGHNLLETIRA